MNDDETVTFEDITVKHATAKAILVEIEGEDQWIPKSQIHDDSEVYGDGKESRGPGKLIVSRWLAETKGLVEKE